MDKTALMNGRQALGERGTQLAETGWFKWPFLRDNNVQGRPRNVAGYHERRICGRIGIYDLRGVEAPDPADCLDLPCEPQPKIRVVSVLGAYDLDRNLSPARRLAEKHLPHAASAESADQPVAAHLARIATPQGIHAPTLPDHIPIIPRRTLLDSLP
jgi:hypothetical protein